MEKKLNSQNGLLARYPAQIVLFFILSVRILAMVLVPLNDSTEARYGEMARKMLITHDWVTLWHDTGIPFWGKPPLSIWMGALSLKYLGISEFALRLPALFLSIGMLVMMRIVTKRYRGEQIADVSVIVLASSFLFYLVAGTMMTDAALLFGLFLSQLAFWHALHQTSSGLDERISGYLFFIGIAIGLLAKGPLVLVLLAGSSGVWVCLQHQWRQCWQKLPWFGGSLLVMVLVLPWYILAEIKTPGFLQYFIVGEHLGRFLQSAWQGDKYGFAHAQMLGIIWLYALMGLMPWVAWLVWTSLQKKGRLLMREMLKQNKPSWVRYWLICFLFPCIFFTFSSNLIYPYVLPAAPAFAILFAEGWVLYSTNSNKDKHLLRTASLVGIGFLIGVLLFIFSPQYVSKSQDKMIALWQSQPDYQDNPLVYFDTRMEFSAQFYSRGQVVLGDNLNKICPKIQKRNSVYFVVTDVQLPHLKEMLNVDLQVVGEMVRLSTHSYLIRVDGLPFCK